MEITSKRNFLIILAAILVVGMGIMALTLSNELDKDKGNDFDRQIESIMQQDESTKTEDIEKDLLQTDLEDLDSELDNIEKELETL